MHVSVVIQCLLHPTLSFLSIVCGTCLGHVWKPKPGHFELSIKGPPVHDDVGVRSREILIQSKLIMNDTFYFLFVSILSKMLTACVNSVKIFSMELKNAVQSIAGILEHSV